MAVVLTENANQQVRKFMKSVGMEKGYVRIGVQTSCSGTVYDLSLDPSLNEGDLLVTLEDNLNVIFDKQFQGELSDVVIDYKQVNEQFGFVFQNNNSMPQRKCCGGKCHN
jgi:iron-sulfur cluster assembly accessory protein